MELEALGRQLRDSGHDRYSKELDRRAGGRVADGSADGMQPFGQEHMDHLGGAGALARSHSGSRARACKEASGHRQGMAHDEKPA